MACGTGKTLTSLWLAETKVAVRRAAGQPTTILLLFPNLMLLQQTLLEFDKHARAGSGLAADDGIGGGEPLGAVRSHQQYAQPTFDRPAPMAHRGDDHGDS